MGMITNVLAGYNVEFGAITSSSASFLTSVGGVGILGLAYSALAEVCYCV